MNDILIDSSVIISLLKRELSDKAKEFILSKNSSISIITFLETARYYYINGLKNKWLDAKKELENFEILDLTPSVAERAASFSDKLSLADSIIYATALENNLALATKDKDFKGFNQAIILK